MRTNTTANLGDKIAQTKINKKIQSLNIREKRRHFVPMVGHERPSNICLGCGFHIRGKNHLEGAHHNGNVAVCHRGR